MIFIDVPRREIADHVLNRMSSRPRATANATLGSCHLGLLGTFGNGKGPQRPGAEGGLAFVAFQSSTGAPPYVASELQWSRRRLRRKAPRVCGAVMHRLRHQEPYHAARVAASGPPDVLGVTRDGVCRPPPNLMPPSPGLSPLGTWGDRRPLATCAKNTTRPTAQDKTPRLLGSCTWW